WFSYHLEIKNVPHFKGICLHHGGGHHDTAGCILVSDSSTISSENKTLTNSKYTFEQLYRFLERQIGEGKKVQLTIKDEQWINQLQ
ncbi:MAG: hypothetical protein HC819_07205, partial [Cyclobacteriaceae bacterium]|nr:hypothetical protein [Cyclobacteriaceae bacterium]